MRIFSIFITVFLLSALALAEQPGIQKVSVYPASFNPSNGQKVVITTEVDRAGVLSLAIVDRDGFVIRDFETRKVNANEKIAFTWNGFDRDGGSIVADEAYSVRLLLIANGKTFTYFPADSIVDMYSVREATYSRQDGILSYRLPVASRVHLQAGVAYTDPVTKKQVDFVTKTLVNREPRPAGAIVESWGGWDESETIRASELKNFIVGIAGTPLPENSLIVYGNRSRRFLDSVATRKGTSLFTVRTDHHHHHKSLSALDDVSPTMKILDVANAEWNKTNLSWDAAKQSITVSGEITGVSSAHFTKQPGFIAVFVDGKNVRQISAPVSPFKIEIPIDQMKAGDHIVVVNWASNWGPVAANSFRLKVQNKSAQSKLR